MIMDDKTAVRLERIVLSIFSIYTLAMFFMSQLSGWSIFFKEVIFLTVAVSWAVHFRQYRNRVFRAKFISVMAWANLGIYALHTGNFLTVLSTMAGIIVLLGIFCVPWSIYLGMLTSTAVFLYHGLIVKTMDFSTPSLIIGNFLQFLVIYTVSGITLIVIHTQQEAREKLLKNIQELELAERSKDDFVVNISHEIRTPINAVCGMSEAILQENPPMEVRRDVIDIQTAGRSLLSTVSNILDFSELESGKMELAEESYNITSTITDIINMALMLENGRKLELIVDCDADLPSSLLGDEQKFRRIVMNLLDNAIKFTKEGGVILRIKNRKEQYGTNLVVSIRDSGIGMERADLEKIFTSFSQIDSRRNREEGGIGLGLAITQALVRRMGGFITVKSTPGEGSLFRFTIPQKVLDETPIVSIKNKRHLYAALYINMEKYSYSIVREGYESCVSHITEQLGIMIRVNKNLAELKRRLEYENFSHVFISWSEYCEDKNFFEQLAGELTVVLIMDYGQETQMGSNMLRIYKPFTVLSIAAVFNGQKVIQKEGQQTGMGRRFIAPKAKVLVIDDNAMNLKVMARLLLPYQIKVIMAGSGQEALDKLDSMDYDCVFLDHMMPEMDGVETLHRLRKKPGVYFQSLPVIAFTANAIGGAREMFLGEGFDDFIAKPIELSVLERMLRRYIPARKQIAIEENAPGDGQDVSGASRGTGTQKGSGVQGSTGARKADMPESTGAGASGNTDAQGDTGVPGSIGVQKATGGEGMRGSGGVSGGVGSQDSGEAAKALNALSRAGINVSQGILYCGDEEGFREIVGIYHAEGSGRRCRLEQYFREQDWKNYVITVHALKSNSRGIGADELAELAGRLELAGRENRIDYIQEHHEELLEKQEALLKVLAANAFICPDGYAGEAENNLSDTGAAGETSEPDGGTVRPVSLQAKPVKQEPAQQDTDLRRLVSRLALLREKLDSFESEGMEDVLKGVAECRFGGTPLTELAEKIREKVEDFDFLEASDLLAAWEAGHLTGQEGGINV